MKVDGVAILSHWSLHTLVSLNFVAGMVSVPCWWLVVLSGCFCASCLTGKSSIYLAYGRMARNTFSENQRIKSCQDFPEIVLLWIHIKFTRKLTKTHEFTLRKSQTFFYSILEKSYKIMTKFDVMWPFPTHSKLIRESNYPSHWVSLWHKGRGGFYWGSLWFMFAR